MIDIFEEQVARSPLAIAARFQDRSITYDELNSRSARLACWLQLSGVGEGSLVPLCMERSLDIITAILGVMKAGAAYIPINPGYPEERIKYILADCNAKGSNMQRRYKPPVCRFP